MSVRHFEAAKVASIERTASLQARQACQTRQAVRQRRTRTRFGTICFVQAFNLMIRRLSSLGKRHTNPFHRFSSFVLNGFHTTGAVLAAAPAFISHRQERVS
jgi:hypothetical protein